MSDNSSRNRSTSGTSDPARRRGLAPDPARVRGEVRQSARAGAQRPVGTRAPGGSASRPAASGRYASQTEGRRASSPSYSAYSGTARRQAPQRGSAPGAKRPASYSSPRVSQGHSSPARRAPLRKGAEKPSLARRALKAISRVPEYVVMGVTGFNHLFDRFRTTEAKRIVTNTLLTSALLLVLASVFMLAKPGIDARKAVSQARKGNATRALQLLDLAQSEGLGQARLDKTRVKAAASLAETGHYTASRQVLSEVTDPELTRAQAADTDYREASALFNQGAYTEASPLFYRLGSYLDSADKYTDCLCAIAVKAYLGGSEARARSLLAELPDAESRLFRIFTLLGHQELAQDPLFSAESLSHMRQSYQLLLSSRQSARKGLIASGARHSLVVRSNGTVLSAGDNLQGQCMTGSWSNVSMVAAGSAHSVALRQDGTVLACGNNSQGQCDVSSWSGITMIAAGAYSTVGLKSDGSVIACGQNADSVSTWRSVQQLCAGGYSLGALSANGSMLCSHQAALLPPDVKMFDLAISGPVSCGILYDGSLIASLEHAPEWQNLISVSASEQGIFAIDQNGAVLSRYFRSQDDPGIGISSGAAEIAAGGEHVLVLTNDGRVYAFGDNSYGQLAVNGTVR